MSAAALLRFPGRAGGARGRKARLMMVERRRVVKAVSCRDGAGQDSSEPTMQHARRRPVAPAIEPSGVGRSWAR